MTSGSRRGQALVEFALMLPVMTMVLLGTIDLGRAFYVDVAITGASRAGARVGITSDTSDIGDFIRSEPNSALTNTVATWGATGPGGARANCTGAPGGQTCGDAAGCAASSFAAGQVACWAIRTCVLSPGPDLGTCASYGPWGSRPASGGGANGLQVVVVYKFTLATPFASLVLNATSNNLFLTATTVGDEVYY